MGENVVNGGINLVAVDNGPLGKGPRDPDPGRPQVPPHLAKSFPHHSPRNSELGYYMGGTKVCGHDVPMYEKFAMSK